MTKKDIIMECIKHGIGFLTGIGVTALCNTFTGKLIESKPVGKLQRGCMAIGGAVVGAMAADAAKNYIYKEVDSVNEAIDGLTNLIETLKVKPE